MALPLGLVIVLSIGWVAYWFIASQVANAGIDRFIRQNLARGIEITCAERTLDGFPFRFIVTCRNTRIAVNRSGRVVIIDLPKLRGVVQAYNPTHIIAEPSGPIDIAVRQPGQADRFARASWAEMRFSLRLSGFNFSSGDMTATEMSFWRGASSAALTSTPFLAIKNYEGHIRQAISGSGQSPLPDFDFAANATDLVHQPITPGGDPIAINDISTIGTVFDLPLREIGDRPNFFRAWQQAGGKLQIDKLWIDGPDTAANIAGSLTLTPTGRPQGAIAIDIVDIEQLSRHIDNASTGSGLNIVSFMLQMVRNIATPSTVDGTPSVRLDIDIDDGIIKVQGTPVTRIDPLFPNPRS